MPAPILKQYTASPSANAVFFNIVTAVPANRAFVVSKLTIATEATVNGFYVGIGTSSAVTSGRFIANTPLAVGECYTETGLVVPSGCILYGYVSMANTSAFASAYFNAFGQEVDN